MYQSSSHRIDQTIIILIMSTDAPLTSQGAEPYVPPPMEQGSIQQQQQGQPQQPEKSTKDIFKSCFTSKAMKFIVRIAVFIICPTLMGVVGFLCPFFLIRGKVPAMFPPFLFSIYTLFVHAQSHSNYVLYPFYHFDYTVC